MNNTSFKEQVMVWLIRAVAYSIVLSVGVILFDIVWKGLPVLSWDFITGMPRKSGAEGGILPAIVGTIWLVTGAVIVAFPISLATAIYLTEYSHRGRFTSWIRLAISTLAGVPSIVFGLFGLGLFVIFFDFGTSVLAGSLTLAMMILPTTIIACEEALLAIPRELREGSLALGASRWQTITRNVLPYALPGIFTGFILGIGRAAGETAPILLTAAAFFLPRLPSSMFDQVMALPYHLYILATQHPDAQKVEPMQYGTALVLLILVSLFNVSAIMLRHRLRKKYRW